MCKVVQEVLKSGSRDRFLELFLFVLMQSGSPTSRKIAREEQFEFHSLGATQGWQGGQRSGLEFELDVPRISPARSEEARWQAAPLRVGGFDPRPRAY